MAEFPRPRLPGELKRQIVRDIVACTDERQAAVIVERLWARLRGDMQDRITSLIHAVKGAVEADDIESRREDLRRNVKLLDGKEIAATEIPQAGLPSP